MWINKKNGKPSFLVTQDDNGWVTFTREHGSADTETASASDFFEAHREATREEINEEFGEDVEAAEAAEAVQAPVSEAAAAEAAASEAAAAEAAAAEAAAAALQE